MRAAAHDLGLPDSLEHPELINLHSPMVATLAKLLLKLGESMVTQGLARYVDAAAALDEAASLCGKATSSTNGALHARVALARGHVARVLAAGSVSAAAEGQLTAAETALVAGRGYNSSTSQLNQSRFCTQYDKVRETTETLSET